VPYLSALEVRSRLGAIQIHVYLYLYLLYVENNLVIAARPHALLFCHHLERTNVLQVSFVYIFIHT